MFVTWQSIYVCDFINQQMLLYESNMIKLNVDFFSTGCMYVPMTKHQHTQFCKTTDHIPNRGSGGFTAHTSTMKQLCKTKIIYDIMRSVEKVQFIWNCGGTN